MNANELFDLIGETPAKFVLDAASTPARRRPASRVLLIAALIVTGLLLMGSAIAALIAMNVEKVERNILAEATAGLDEEAAASVAADKEGEKVNFDPVKDVYVELGDFYPQVIPDGYTMTFVSNGAPLESQLIWYENEAGNYIYFRIMVGNSASDVEIYHIENKENVTINGNTGILYHQENGFRTLVWADEKEGYGFALKTDDVAVDLLAMARSTAEGEPLVPTRSESTVKALEQLGDFCPAYLPEGYEENGVIGSPLDEGGGWYSYVNKYYVNKAENTSIYFEYQTYVIDTEAGYTDDARTVCYFFIPDGHLVQMGQTVGEETEVGGMFGIATETDIAWADPEGKIVYHMFSEDITGEELLKVARSIYE